MDHHGGYNQLLTKPTLNDQKHNAGAYFDSVATACIGPSHEFTCMHADQDTVGSTHCHLCIFLQEILLPIIMVGFLAVMRLAINPKVLPVVPHFDSIKLDSQTTNLHYAEFFVFPDKPESNFILPSALSALGLSLPHISYFNSSKEAEQAYLEKNGSSFVVGVDFQKIASGQEQEYSIRLPINRVPETSQTLDLGNLRSL